MKRLLFSILFGFVISLLVYALAFFVEPNNERVGFFFLWEMMLTWPVSKILGDFKTDEWWPMALGLITLNTIIFSQ